MAVPFGGTSLARSCDLARAEDADDFDGMLSAAEEGGSGGGRPYDLVEARRLLAEPVVAAGSVPGYGPIFNAGVIHHDGRYHLFARAVRDGYRPNEKKGRGEPRFLDYISDVLVFVSFDGVDYDFQQVLHRSDPNAVYEDPRVQCVTSKGEPRFLLSYTHVPAASTGKPWRAGLTELYYAGGAFSCGPELLLGLENVPNKDVVLCNLEDGRIALIQRLERMAQNIQLATFDSLDELWATTPEFWHHYVDTLPEQTILVPSPGAHGIGAGAPPILVDGELLFFYHERDGADVYRTRVALLDRRTGRVRSLLTNPILAPELDWELDGDVDNVIFVQGAQLREDGTIYLSYGAADRHVGAASVEAAPLLAKLRAATVPAALPIAA